MLFAYYIPTFFKRKSCSSFASYEIVQPCTTLSNFNIKITYLYRGKDKQPEATTNITETNYLHDSCPGLMQASCSRLITYVWSCTFSGQRTPMGTPLAFHRKCKLLTFCTFYMQKAHYSIKWRTFQKSLKVICTCTVHTKQKPLNCNN